MTVVSESPVSQAALQQFSAALPLMWGLTGDTLKNNSGQS